MAHQFNGAYTDDNLNRTAFPMGGIGAGMICLEGNGSFSHVSLRHKADVFNTPLMFGAISVKQTDGWKARRVEGRTADWKVLHPWGEWFESGGQGARGKSFGYPFFRECSLKAAFPAATVELSDPEMPLQASVTGWSPFAPGKEDDASLPLAVVEYTFANNTNSTLESVFTFASENFMEQAIEKEQCCDGGVCDTPKPDHATLKMKNGFILSQPQGQGHASRQGEFAAHVLDNDAVVNCQWFRGGWFDFQTELWRQISQGETPDNGPYTDDIAPSRGGSVAVRFNLEPGETRTIPLLMNWYVPAGKVAAGGSPDCCDTENTYKPWYTGAYKDLQEVIYQSTTHYQRLRDEAFAFSDTLASLEVPDEVKEAVSANLGIIKSPTVLRVQDGRLWAWEGCFDQGGCCHGSCTHVWNYAQAFAHLFPVLERSFRVTEFGEMQNDEGHQNFRVPLPLSEANHNHYAAADGQLGGIMKMHRDWKKCGDDEWLRGMYPAVKLSMDYCIGTWDPDRVGMLVEPHHNTYDIEFWGPNGMCTSFYLGALKAMTLMGEALGEPVGDYDALYKKGRHAMETELWDGEYFNHKVQWEGLRAPNPAEVKQFIGGGGYDTPEAQALLKAEGPKYQYGTGCLADGVLGAWMAEVCGIGEILDPEKVKSHLLSVYKYNFKDSLHAHANPQRPGYAMNDEAGLLLCTWPKGGRLSLPFPYSEEVWTGIEYHVAGHLQMFGETQKCLDIVRAVRKRYDGRVRNPFNEYECGHFYARAMSSFGLLQAFGIDTNFTQEAEREIALNVQAFD